MRLLICIDDTDNLDSKGTGSIADELRQIVEDEGFGKGRFTTRHQLLLHEDIPYTSHNSSMCFECEIKPERYEELLNRLFEHLKQESAPEADPGLAVVKIDEVDAKTLLSFGMDAKRMVLTKKDAYKTAETLGVHLVEAGGTGQGVVGALAGAGLRLGGNDGEIKGAYNEFAQGQTYALKQLLASPNLEVVLDDKLQELPKDARVEIIWKAKCVLMQGRAVLLVTPTDRPGLWKTLNKTEMRRFGDERIYKAGCESYHRDVEEEAVEAAEGSCLNCRYRRWTKEGFLCILRPQKFDAVVIGGGVIGAFVARHLTKTQMSVAILEKNSDICCEGTRANTAIVHSGYSGKPGTLKAQLTVRANENFHNVCDDLQVEFERCGSLMVVTNEKGISKIQDKFERGLENGVKGLRIISREEALEMEPNINPDVAAALYSPATGVVNPWELGIAAIENAVAGGAKLFLKTKVLAIKKRKNGYLLHTSSGDFKARYVINCAGLYSDEINDMVNEPFFAVMPRRGDYYLLDTQARGLVSRVIFTARGDDDPKGIIVAPTVHGNILLGPTAVDIEDKGDNATTDEGLATIRKEVSNTVLNVPFDMIIRSFSGVRARPAWLLKDPETGELSRYENDVKDFIIGEESEGFFNAAGIKSPGLTCADEIGQYVAGMVVAKMDNPQPNENFNPRRKEVARFAAASLEQQQALIEQDKNYGKIICRCRKITEAEIIDAIRRNAGATSLDGVKRRAGTGLGRCQGGFCAEKVLRILARELNLPIDQIENDQGGATVVHTK
jgi:glycerol-3-phosphate dehydrogenase